MNRIEGLNGILAEVKTKIYDKLAFNISKVYYEPEGTKYDACQFELNGMRIIGRSAKITPKKTGQFVTCWKRNIEGITEPFSETDKIDFYVINVKFESSLGQFVFPKSVLINNGIISSEKKVGKRGFRIYPKWVNVISKQAYLTQKWQLNYFYDINDDIDLEIISNLYIKK